jgi:hypothetical protein
MDMRSWEQAVFEGFRLATFLVAIAAVFLIEVWGLVKIWRILRKVAAFDGPAATISRDNEGTGRLGH